MNHMQPEEPSLGLLLLGYALFFLGAVGLAFQVPRFIPPLNLNWHTIVMSVIWIVLIISGILLLRRDNRLMAELKRKDARP